MNELHPEAQEKNDKLITDLIFKTYASFGLFQTLQD